MSEISKDSYWFVDGGPDEDSQFIRAMCIKCHENYQIGWFWPGRTTGYGDYDLKCKFCDQIIHQRNEKYED